MKIHSSEFYTSSNKVSECPDKNLPEFAFIGRSNVGKSSLINSLCNKKSIARTSSKPGKTLLINHFMINNSFFIVDLPGYGYASAPKADIKAWTKLTRQFLSGRQSLQRVFLLIDSRRGIGTADEDVMALLNKTAVSFAVVITKADKLKVPEMNKLLENTEQKTAKQVAAFPKIWVTSSEKDIGITELRAHIAGLALTH